MPPRRIATVLRELRAARNMTQEDLVRRAKITRSYLAGLESGHRRNPSLPVLKRLARALGVPLTALLE